MLGRCRYHGMACTRSIRFSLSFSLLVVIAHFFVHNFLPHKIPLKFYVEHQSASTATTRSDYAIYSNRLERSRIKHTPHPLKVHLRTEPEMKQYHPNIPNNPRKRILDNEHTSLCSCLVSFYLFPSCFLDRSPALQPSPFRDQSGPADQIELYFGAASTEIVHFPTD